MAEDARITIVDGASWGGHDYYILWGGTWLQTEAFARTFGGHLVTIEDESENTWLKTRFASQATAWIGKYIHTEPNPPDSEVPGGDGYMSTDLFPAPGAESALRMYRFNPESGIQGRGTGDFTIDLADSYIWVSGSTATYSNWLTPPTQVGHYVSMVLGLDTEALGLPPETNGSWIESAEWIYRLGIVEVEDPSFAKPAWGLTSAGLDVSVQPQTTDGTVSVAALQFPFVDQGGVTSVFPQGSGPGTPGNFTLLGTYYELTTNAAFRTEVNPENPDDTSGKVRVTFTYELPAGLTDADISLGHFENGQWTVIAVGGSVDPTTGKHTISGYVTSLSPFAVLRPSNSPPVANAGSDATIEAASASATSVTLDGSGSADPDNDALTYEWTGDFGSASGATPTVELGMGVHSVTLTVTDSHGASSSDTVDVTIADTTAPTVSSVVASPDSLWPPHHQMVTVTITGQASDACDPSPVFQIVSVTSNEATDGLGDGDTAEDWRVTGAMSLELRAERSGAGDGRVYTITVTCTDASGNTSRKAVTVRVPKAATK